MKTKPEKALERFWKSAEVDFWTLLAEHAPDDRYYNLYLAQILKSKSLLITPMTELHQGVKGVTMFCPVCLSEYHDVHPTEPAFCASGHAATRVRLAKDIVAVGDAVQRHQIRRMRR